MARRLGIFLCLLGFAAVCVLPLVLDTSAPFGSLARIEDDIELAAAPIIDAAIAVPADAEGAKISAEGRDLQVTLPAVVTRDYDQAGLLEQLGQIDGVRSVEFGERIPLLLPDEAPTPEAAAPTPAPEPEADPTPERAAEPTAEPSEPAPEPTPELQIDAAEAVAELSILDIEFLAGTPTLTAGDTGQLTNAANLLTGNLLGGPIEVQSHTSDEGDPDVNLLLTQDRAQAIVQFLISQGVDPADLVARGYGGAQPLTDNDGPAARAQNERVVFIVQEG